MTIYRSSFSSPIGMLDVFSSDKGVVSLQPRDGRERVDSANGDPHGAVPMLARYFDGALDAFEGLPLDLRGTPFQLEVWGALRAIPASTTTSYGALARKIGRPNASRAVGMANSKNPVMIVVPCHRVIGASGALTGYAGGIERKAWLLQHERRGHALERVCASV